MESHEIREIRRLMPRILKMDPSKIGVGRISHEILRRLHELQKIK